MLSQKFVFRKSKNFTSSNGIQMPPTIPINHYGDSRNQQNRTARPISLFHANVFRRRPALNTLISQGKSPGSPAHPVKGMSAHQEVRPGQTVRTVRRTVRPGLKFNYELFNCNNFNIRYWSWNYRGCWHQTCPPIVPR